MAIAVALDGAIVAAVVAAFAFAGEAYRVPLAFAYAAVETDYRDCSNSVNTN